MVNIRINNKELTVSKELTILQAASLIDIQIPRFCYHEKLSIAGNCRMCLVEMAKVNKPIASCALPVSEGMQVYTNSILVKKAREGVLELLLANHPLDCPICDQGGECDLQDQALIFGNDRSRFYEIKRAVLDKTISPFIKTIMTRCIHCTRCVRFLNEVAGVAQLGVTGRGNGMEIGTYVENTINSEISGNVIDLCPVGALTSKPYAFTARPWELKSVETIDLSDALGANIKVDTRGPTIMRVLPRINEQINEEWITDKTRFNFDGFQMQRLNSPMYVQKAQYYYNFNNYNLIEDTKYFINCNWEEAFAIFYENLFLTASIKKRNLILGNQPNIETLVLLKQFGNKFNFNFTNQSFYNESFFQNDFQSNYSFNAEVKELEKIDVCLLVNTNLRLENPLLNTRLRKAFLTNNCIVASIGPNIDSVYNLQKLGNSFKTFLKIIEGKHSFSSVLKTARNPLIIIGNCFIPSNLINTINKYLKNNIKLSVLNPHVGNLNLNEVGVFLKPGIDVISNFKNNFFYLIQTDELFFNKSIYLKNNNNFIVYQGFHGDRMAQMSDLILPTCNSLEEIATYYNLNGKVQSTSIVVPSPTGARTTWKILIALRDFFFKENIHSLDGVSILKQNQKILKNKLSNIISFEAKSNKIKIKVPNILINNVISNYFNTDSLTRTSKIMSYVRKNSKFGTTNL